MPECDGGGLVDSDTKTDGSELIEALGAGIAHEVRNPLNSLQINLRILQEELAERLRGPDERIFGLIGRISAELKRLDDFVSEFLRFARPPRIKPESVPVRALLGDLVSFLGPECHARGVEIKLDADQGPPTAFVDPLQLKQAVLNLLLNSLQATPPSGRITVRTGGNAQELTISVIDNGEGIPEALKDKLFSVFFSTREGGTGLGLPIVRRIAAEHGGAVRIESTVGRGTTATMILPMRQGA